jgi:hypothetical protein
MTSTRLERFALSVNDKPSRLLFLLGAIEPAQLGPAEVEAVYAARGIWIQPGPPQPGDLLVDPDLAHRSPHGSASRLLARLHTAETPIRSSNEEDRCRLANVRADSGTPDSERGESPDRPSGCMLDP